MTEQELKDILIRAVLDVARKRGIDVTTDNQFRHAAAAAIAARLANTPLTLIRGRPKI